VGGMWREVCGRVRLVGTDVAVDQEEHTVAEPICPTDDFMHAVNREIVDFQSRGNY